MYKLKTKKINKIKNKKNKKNKNILKGGDYNEISEILQTRVRETYEFLDHKEHEDSAEIYKDITPDYLFKIEGDNIIDSENYNYDFKEEIREAGRYSGVEYSEQEKAYYDKSNLYLCWYHGAHEEEIYNILPNNVYLCILGLFDTLSFKPASFLGEKQVVDYYFKNMYKSDFQKIISLKAYLSEPFRNSYTARYSNRNILVENAYTNASWVYPGQKYVELYFAKGSGPSEVPYSFHNYCENGTFKQSTIQNEEETKLSQFIKKVKCMKPADEHVIFVYCCRVNKIYDIKDSQIKKMLQISYKNQSMNYAITKKYVDKQILPADYFDSQRDQFVFLSGRGTYKNIFFMEAPDETLYREIKAENIPKKNDNLHPSIPKLRFIYNNLIVLDRVGVQQYFKKNPNDIAFLINLSFNKLRKFLSKLQEKSHIICNTVIKCIKDDKYYIELFGSYYNNFDMFMSAYKDFDERHTNIFHNFKIYKLLFDFIELTYLINGIKPSFTENPFNDTDFSFSFYLKGISKKKIVQNPSKFIFKNYNGKINPFISDHKSILKNIVHLEVKKCPGFKNLFKFSDFPSTEKKLKILNIDDTVFDFYDDDGSGLEYIIDLFDGSESRKYLILDNIELKNYDNRKDFTFSKFVCVNLNFKIRFNIDSIEIQQDPKENEQCNLLNLYNIKNIKGTLDIISNKQIYTCNLIDVEFEKEPTDYYINLALVEEDIFNFELNNIIFKNAKIFNDYTKISHLVLSNIKYELEPVDFESTKIDISNVFHLEIYNCEFKNVIFNLKKVEKIVLERNRIKYDSQMPDSVRDWDLTHGGSSFNIIIQNNRILQFNFFVRSKLINSYIKIKNNNNTAYLGSKKRKKGSIINAPINILEESMLKTLKKTKYKNDIYN